MERSDKNPLQRSTEKAEKDKVKGRLGDFRIWHPARSSRNPIQDGTEVVKNDASTPRKFKATNNEFNLNDYVWHNSSAQTRQSGILKNGDIPQIIIKEFQPEAIFNTGEVFEALFATLSPVVKGLLGGVGGTFKKKVFKTSERVAAATAAGKQKLITAKAKKKATSQNQAIDFVGSALKNGVASAAKFGSTAHINKLINDINLSPAEFQNSVIELPVKLVREMFQGEFIQTFHVPYYGDTYLFANGQSDWARGGLEQIIGTAVGEFAQKNLSLDVPSTPTWKNVDGGGTPPEIETELILWNKDIESLIKNYRFVHALISGAYWSQIRFNQKSPNLYDIEIPGRLHHFYCTLDCELSFVGKARTLQSNTLQKFTNGFGSNAEGAPKLKVNSLATFPDAYRLNLKFKSLMPNSFNMYLDYLLKGSSNESGVIDRFSQLALLGQIIGEVVTEMIPAGLAEGKRQAQAVIAEVLNL